VIDSYTFGHIVTDGKEYTSDLIVFPDRIKDHRLRKSGHSLTVEDIGEIIRARPEILIIGCGASGVLKIPVETKSHIQEQGIRLIAEETKKRVKCIIIFAERNE
jgi:hypothetical protein